MSVIGRLKLARVVACLAAILLARSAHAQSQQHDPGLRTSDLLSIQLYAIGGGFMPFATNGNETSVDMSNGGGSFSISNQAGGTPSRTSLLGARVHVPLMWHMQNEQSLGFSVFFETGFQSGLGAQSFIQPFQNANTTAGEFGSSVVREYYQVPLLAGLTVPIANRSTAPTALLDFYGGFTLDSWSQVLQGGENNAPGQQGFYGENRRFSANPTVGVGIRLPVGNIDAGLPIFVGVNAELQYRPGSVVTAVSNNFATTYYGTVDPHANLAVMARIGIAFGGQ